MQFHHYGVEVSNLAESVGFYKNALGFTEETRMVFMGEQIVFLVSEEMRIELISGGVEGTDTTHICFEVNDLHEVMNQMDSHLIMEGPYKLENGWATVFYKGLGGEIIELLQKTGPLK